MGIVNLLVNLPASTLVIAFLILLLIVSFFVIFVGQSVVIFSRLRKVTKALARLTNPDKQALKRIFAGDGAFSHLWTKYSETLHREQEAGNAGQSGGVLRSTVPASVVFTTDSMVDARIGTEFFKHVPGIFTGLGIIGTFSGLIRGLQHFDATANPDAVRTSLAGLMQHVGDAFVVSAIAIGAAMMTTAIERLFVTILYKRVEDVTTALDGFFTTGVGEDYLARLTRASEKSAAEFGEPEGRSGRRAEGDPHQSDEPANRGAKQERCSGGRGSGEGRFRSPFPTARGPRRYCRAQSSRQRRRRHAAFDGRTSRF